MYKIVIYGLTLLLIGDCQCQQQQQRVSNPQVWARNSQQKTQESAREVLVNTDRLIQALESRLLTTIRNENEQIRQDIGKIAKDLNSLKNDVKFISEKFTGNDDDKVQGQFKSLLNVSGPDDKFADLGFLVNAVSVTVNKIERDVANVKKNLRAVQTSKRHHQQPSATLMVSNKNFLDLQTCTTNDENQESGIRRFKNDFYAFCDMDTNDGSWIVIQTRYEGFFDFYRPWSDYKEGFGNIAGEFWLGLEKIHQLTSTRLYELRIEMESFDNTKKFAAYSAFAISDESNGYALKLLGEYSGDAGDSLTYHAGMKFSTYDNDNDVWANGDCAKSHLGGWWYKSCDQSNLNGKYFQNGTIPDDFTNLQSMYWNTFNQNEIISLQTVRMMIKPIEF